MGTYIGRIFLVSLSLTLLLLSAVFVGSANAGPSNDIEAIVIKFKGAAFQSTNGYKLKSDVRNRVIDAGKEYGVTPKLRPLVDPNALARLRGGVTNGGYAKDLQGTRVAVETYFALEGKFSNHGTNAIARLLAVPEVQKAYAAPEVSTPTAPMEPPLTTWYGVQGHLNPAIRGVDAKGAWTATAPRPAGACGEGMHVIDLESGWELTHSAYKSHRPKLLWGSNLEHQKPHGTSVLGVLCANDNGQILGIAPHVKSVRVISHDDRSINIPTAIVRAADELRRRQGGPGGVLVIEAQLKAVGGTIYTPVETEEYTLEVIRDAISAGVVVIEAAGNGGTDLDTLPELNRASGSFQDSGAIMVAGGRLIPATLTWHRTLNSNYGSRIDCFAEAEGVATARHPGNTYHNTFNGTSAATAIIAGVALSTQGMLKNKPSGPFDGVRLRTLLANPATATASATGEAIGVMPDLVRIQTNL